MPLHRSNPIRTIISLRPQPLTGDYVLAFRDEERNFQDAMGACKGYV